MSAHTPGPWKAHFEEAYFVTGPDLGRVAIMMNLKGAHGLGGRRSGDESVANARLIADAPRMHDLLAACEPYLKDGETPAQRIERERRDTAAALELLANERIKNEFALAALRRVKETRVWLGAVAQGMVDDAIKMAEGTT